jgi:2-amino-4-hydroxy-6-hydroxymethyldihydropteridine diphosphokinase
MPVCLVGAGSNLGDRAENLKAAIRKLGSHPYVEVVAASRFHPTSPVGGPGGQEDFLNAAMRLDTSLTPSELMQLLLEVEQSLGRRRTQRWGPRTIDLDILLYDQEVIDLPDLKIPHPRMAFRRFVLEPAAEIASELSHPELGWTVGRALEHLNTAIAYVAIAGLPGAGKSHLAAAVAKRTKARLITDPDGGSEFSETALHDDRGARTHLRCLARRRATLDPGGWPAELSESISDFWFEQTKAYAHSWLSVREKPAYDRSHDEARKRIVPAKLLILLEMDPVVSATGMSRAMSGESHAPTVSRLEEISRRLNELAAMPGRQPVLRLPAADFDRAVSEAVAAVETMR